MKSMGNKPRRRRSFTPEFKAEIVELCGRGDRSAGQVARGFDLTEAAVRSQRHRRGFLGCGSCRNTRGSSDGSPA